MKQLSLLILIYIFLPKTCMVVTIGMSTGNAMHFYYTRIGDREMLVFKGGLGHQETVQMPGVLMRWWAHVRDL